MYEVYLERRAERDLRRLPAGDFDRTIRHIKDLAATPRPAECRKIIGAERDWRIRVGDYRILHEIDDEASAVKVTRVRRRGEAYR